MKAHSLESECRWDQGQEIGEVGGTYEFEIKIPPLKVDMTNEEFEDEASYAIAGLRHALKTKYAWIGRVSQSGRSGGWLEIEDARGGATKAKLQAIINMVTAAKKKFAKNLERNWPR